MSLYACYLKKITAPNHFQIVDIDSILDDIKTEKYKVLIEQLPNSITQNKAYKAEKAKLPAYALNGTFTEKVVNDNFNKSNGLFHFDIDNLSAEKIDDICKSLHSCKYLFALWRSPSGLGLKGLVRVPDDYIHNDADFKKVYTQIEAYFFEIYDLSFDKACKDVRRLCFVCSDPKVHLNKDALPYPLIVTSETGCQEKYIKFACNIIQSAKHGEYHSARLRAGFFAGVQIASGLVDEDEIIQALFATSDTISAIYSDDEHTIKISRKAITDAIDKGRKNPSESFTKDTSHEHVSSFNEILDTEIKYCNVDFLRYVDDDHVLKKLSQQIAEETHLPVNTVFLAGLGVFSSMTCRKYTVLYKNGDMLPIGLYVIIEQPSGASKSRCLNSFQRPFYSIQKGLKRDVQNRIKEINQSTEKLTSEEDKELEELEQKLAFLQKGLFATNTTPEGLEKTLEHTNGFFSAVSSEQGLFNSLLGNSYGNESRANNNDLVLNAFDGGYLNSLRATRNGYNGNVVGAIVCFAQLGSIETVLKASNGTGLSERFLMLTEPHALGKRDHLKPPIKKDLWCLNDYEAACKKLESIIDTPLDIDYLNQLSISEAAFLKIDEYRNKIEPDLIDGGKYSHISLRGAASKINMQIMKIAANLHLLEGDCTNIIPDKHVTTSINIANELLEANLKLCQDKGIMGVKAEFASILTLFERDTKPRSQRSIVQTKSGGKPFKDFSGNKSELIRKTLGEMVKQNLLIVTPIKGKVHYSAA